MMRYYWAFVLLLLLPLVVAMGIGVISLLLYGCSLDQFFMNGSGIISDECARAPHFVTNLADLSTAALFLSLLTVPAALILALIGFVIKIIQKRSKQETL